ncbi:MAG: phosphoserine phosphatase SerB [Caulobacteraceae bacterium]|nr:phosphoserine phosphatase SerB [Caulobacteraceae bacterium]
MLIAVTLVSPDPSAAAGAAAAVAPALGLIGVRVREPRPLGAGAVDLVVEAETVEPVRAAAEAAVQGRPVDVCVQAWEGRRKRLLIADMDSTIIGCECIDELADFAGKKAEISAITERAMRGEIDFESALRERVAMLKGLPTADLQLCYDQRVRLNPGARTLARTMAAHGARCWLVSGGFTFFAGRVAEAAGFQVFRANTLIEAGGALTGEVADPILGREAKLAALAEAAAEAGIGLEETLAVGDGANDLAMIGAAGLGVAYRAKPVVAAEADAKVDHADLTALLYFQGYAASEFAA